RRRGKRSLGSALGARAIHESAMFRLFVNQGRVHFKQSGHAARAGVFHCRKAPKRVAFIDQREWAFAFKGCAERLVRQKALLLSRRQIALWSWRQRMKSNVGEPWRWLPRATCRKKLYFCATSGHGAQHLLDVDRTSFAAEHRHSWIGSDIGDA